MRDTSSVDSSVSRRSFLQRLATGTALFAAGPGLSSLLAACAREAERAVATASPGPDALVKSELILRSSRPLDLETPVRFFEHYLTPNEAFFVRTHHDEPRLDGATWRLKVEGLVDEMNGAPLPYLHGFPARLVVPGWVGDDWVKWLTTLRVQRREFEGFFFQTAYRYPKKPLKPGEKVHPEDLAPMAEMPVKSLITAPLAGSRIPRGAVPIRGVAWTGGDARIAKVEVSTDSGRTWAQARLIGEDRPYAWRQWTFDREPPTGQPRGPLTLMSRATDDRGHSQPVGQSPWNPSGYQWNSADTVEVLYDI